MNQNLLNKENRMMKTVEDLEIYANYPSTDFLMVSELIDNSISSYLFKHKTIKGAKIKIEIDKTDIDNYKLTIIDNGAGMDAITLENAIQFGNPKRLEKNSTLNVYGVGLKQSAFYAGRRLEVLTKTSDNLKPIYTHIFLDHLEKQESKDINFVISESEEKLKLDGTALSEGTKIVISKLRRYRYTVKKAKDDLVMALGWKYNRYLENGLKLDFSYLTNDKKSTFSLPIEPSRPKAENILEWIKAINKNGESKIDYLKKIEDEFSVRKQNITQNTDDEERIRDLLREGRDLIWDVEFVMIDNIKIKGKVGILASPDTIRETEYKGQTYVDSNGYALFQMGRAIKCGPNSKKHKVSTFNVIQDDIGGGTNHERRWFGEFDLDPLILNENKGKYIELDSNKSDIKWIDDSARENFENFLKKIMRDSKEILISLNSVQNHYKVTKKKNISKNDESSSRSIPANVTSSANSGFIYKISMSEAKQDYAYFIKLPDWTSEIKLTLKIIDNLYHDDYFIKYERGVINDNGDENIFVFININHKIWKPGINTDYLSNEMECSIHKIGIIQAISQWIIEYIYDDDNINRNVPDFFKNFKNKNFSEIFSELSSNIFGENNYEKNN